MPRGKNALPYRRWLAVTKARVGSIAAEEGLIAPLPVMHATAVLGGVRSGT